MKKKKKEEEKEERKEGGRERQGNIHVTKHVSYRRGGVYVHRIYTGKRLLWVVVELAHRESRCPFIYSNVTTASHVFIDDSSYASYGFGSNLFHPSCGLRGPFPLFKI